MPTIQLPESAIFQDDNAHINTAKTVKSSFDEHHNVIKHLPWPSQSLDLNITEPLWGVLRQRVRNRFPALSSLKQLSGILIEEWNKIPLETIQNLF